jgi:regulator of cell morphogenesis and NO signaling
MTAPRAETVGELVARRPAAARVFERFGIDYCCGGKRTLEDAARRAGTDGAAVRAALAAADLPTGDDGIDLTSLTLTGLCEYVVETHHAYLRAELPRIDRLLTKVNAAHAARHPELRGLGRVFGEFATELSRHMAKEEYVLFPAIRRLEQEQLVPAGAFGTVANPIRMMEAEHDHAGDALGAMRSLTSGFTPPADACPTYRALLAALAELEADMHRHVHAENNILFPRAIRLEEELVREGRTAVAARELPLL